MKLFVWEGVLSDYTDGTAFAVAATLEQAMEAVAVHQSPSGLGDYVKEELSRNEPKVYPLTETIGFAVWGGG